MNTPESLNAFVCELIRRGLPTGYSERATYELADHHRDLVEELQATGLSEVQASFEASRRLGDSKTLVKKTVREYQRRHWCGRWPLITFLFSPIPLLFLVWVVGYFAILCIGWPLEKLGVLKQTAPDGIVTFGEWLLCRLAFVFICLVAPSVAMFALARLAKRAALPRSWLVLSAGVLGLWIGMVRCQLNDSTTHPAYRMDGQPIPADQSLIMFGCPLFAQNILAAWKWYTRDTQQICQVLLPMVIVAIFTLRAKQLSRRSQQLILDGC